MGKVQKRKQKQPRDYILRTDHGDVVWRMNYHTCEIEIAADNYKAITALVRNAMTYLHENFWCPASHKDFDDYKHHKSYTGERLKELSRPRDDSLISESDPFLIGFMKVVPKIKQLW